MWVPQFQYPVAGTTLTLTRPMGFWSRRLETIGGLRRSSAGVAAARTIRRDYLVDLAIRFTEDEHDNLELLVAWAQDNPATAFTFWPDVEVSGTSYAVYMRSPVHGEEFAPFRRADFASDLEFNITLVRTNGSAWPLVWYPD